MPAHRCEISDAEVGITLSPDEDPNFINRAYVEPTHLPREWLQYRVYVGDRYFEFNRHTVPGTYSEDWVWGGISSCAFQVNDDGPVWNWPCKLVDGQKIRVYDLTGQQALGHWYVRGKPHKEPMGQRRADGSYRGIVSVECVDAWELLLSQTYKFTYTQQHVGAIVKDAFRRGGFDVSSIDETAGPVIDHEVVDEFPATVIEQMMSLMDWTYWFDVQFDPPKPFVGAKESELNRIDLAVNEQNWDKIFAPDPDSSQIVLEIGEANEDYANEVLYTTRRKHSQGLATFQNGSNVMLGYTGSEDWYSINLADTQGGAEVEIPSTGASYRLQENNSVAPGPGNVPPQVAEFILSSNYEQDDTVNGVAYIIKGLWFQLVRRNTTEINRRAALRGGNGIKTKKIIRSDVALTYAEAALVANFELALYSRQYYRGHGVIPTSYHADWALFAVGKTLYLDLPQAKDVQGLLRIEGLRRTALTSRQIFPDGRQSCAFRIEITFTPAMYFDTEQIRALFMSTRKLSAVSSDGRNDTEFIDNLLAAKSCGHLLPPLKEADPSGLETETANQTAPWPTTSARTDYSRFWEPGATFIPTTRG